MTDTSGLTVSVARRVRPGREKDYETWISDISRVAATFPGHQAVNVLRPSQATGGEYVIIYRFDTQEHAQAWENSPERAAFLERLDDLIEGDWSVKRVTGLEFWFDLPQIPAGATPSPHRMALTLIVVVFVLVYLINLVFGSWLALLPLPLRVLALVVLQVLLMTYVVMPRVTQLLKGWLYKKA